MNSATVMQTLNTGFSFQQENYDYDSSGNLNLLKIESIDLSLVNQNEFAATGSGSFYSCTVSLCPGALLFGHAPPVQLTGRRF